MRLKSFFGGIILGAMVGLGPMSSTQAAMLPPAASQDGSSLQQPHSRLFYLYTKKVNVNTEEHKARAKALIFEGRDYSLALAELNLVIAIDKEDAEAFLLRGLTYMELNKLNEAEADYKSALMLEPENPTFYYYRGLNHLLNGNDSRRCNFFTIEGDSSYMDSVSHSTALKMFRKALEIEPNYIDAIVGQGDTYYEIGKDFERYRDGGKGSKHLYRMAIDEYNKVLVLFPNNDVVRAKKEQAEQEIRDLQQKAEEEERQRELKRRIG